MAHLVVYLVILTLNTQKTGTFNVGYKSLKIWFNVFDVKRINQSVVARETAEDFERRNFMKNNLLNIVNFCISHHNSMKNASFRKPIARASDRRKFEDKHTFDYQFELNNHLYGYWSSCTCSKTHIYFSDGFTVDGRNSDVNAFYAVRSVLMENSKK